MSNVDDYEENHIGSLSMRPYLIPLSASKIKMTVVLFPFSKEQLFTDHPLSSKGSFPGLELTSFELGIFPVVNSDSDKTWGCPVIPLIHLGGSEDDHPNLPPTSDIKACISSIFRSALKPDIKRDLRTLTPAWQAIKVSGPSKLKEKYPALIRPL